MDNSFKIFWLDEQLCKKGHLGMGRLPGRYSPDIPLEKDLDVIVRSGVNTVVMLVKNDELVKYAVSDIIDQYLQRGITVLRLPVEDMGVPSPIEMDTYIQIVTSKLETGEKVLVHCVGGLGRTGLFVASYLVSNGMRPEQAINTVREARSHKAIETGEQVQFVHEFFSMQNGV